MSLPNDNRADLFEAADQALDALTEVERANLAEMRAFGIESQSV